MTSSILQGIEPPEQTLHARMAGIEEIAFRAPGATLAGTLFRPPGEARAAVVIHGATGVPQGFYRAFATWLAEERNLLVLTYDYRDFGRSQRGGLRRSRATMADWGSAISRRRRRR